MNKDSAFGQLSRLTFALLGGMLLAWIATSAVLLAHTSFDVQAAFGQTGQLLQQVNLLRLIQGVQSLCIFVVPPFLFCLINGERPGEVLSFRKASGSQLLLAIFSLVAAIPLINVTVALNQSMQLPAFLQGLEEWMRITEKTAEELTQRMMSGTEWYDLAFSLIVVAVVAGFGEELLFRGLLQGMLIRLLGRKQQVDKNEKPAWVMHTSIWVVAFLFSAIHLQFFGFFPRMLLGAWFGYLFWWTGTIWVPILAHMANNALSTFFLFAESNKWVTENPDRLGTHETWWISILSALLLTTCAILIKRKRPV